MSIHEKVCAMAMAVAYAFSFVAAMAADAGELSATAKQRRNAAFRTYAWQYGAFADVRARIVDYDTGAPIEGAEVYVHPNGGTYAEYEKLASEPRGSKSWVSDEDELMRRRQFGEPGNLAPQTCVSSQDGRAMLSLETRRDKVQCYAVRDDYYPVLFNIGIREIEVNEELSEYKWKTDECTVRMRKKANPHEMRETVLNFSEACAMDKAGFDAELGEFLPPHGNGRVADLLVSWREWNRLSMKTISADSQRGPVYPSAMVGYLIIEPVDEAGGLYAAPRVDDSLCTDREASADAAKYSKTPFKTMYFLGGFRRGLSSTAGNDLISHQLVFRSRVKLNDDGAAASAHYGVVYMAADARQMPDFRCRWSPVENERSLEPSK